MPDIVAMADRHESLLSELAQLGIAMARDLQARAAAASDVAEAAEMALAFHRISRSLRQTVALEAKLARDRHAPEVRAAEREQRNIQIRRRHAELRTKVQQAVWAEYEVAEALEMTPDIDELVFDAMKDDGFLDEPIEDQVARICDLLRFYEEDEPDDPDLPPLDGEGDSRSERGGATQQPPPVSAFGGSTLPTEGEGEEAAPQDADDAWRSSA